jgi:nicotinate-nucleotide pyrophosphorylase (carboxylating)
MLRRAIADAHEVGGFSLLLNIAIRDGEEANDTIAADAVGTLDNIERSRPISVVWRLREHRTWEGRKYSPRRMGNYQK